MNVESSLASAPIESLVEHLFCCSLRSFGFVAFWPLEQQGSAFSLKLILSLALGLSGMVGGSYHPTTITDLSLVLSEILFGILLALPVVFLLCLVEWWAELFDTGRGQNLGSILDPMQQQEGNALGALLRSLFWVLLLSSPVILHSVATLISTFRSVPVGSLANFWSQEVFIRMINCLHTAFTSFVWIAAPFAVFFLLIELCIGLAGKLLPQVSLTQESFVLKTFFGSLGMVALGNSDLLKYVQTAVAELSIIEPFLQLAGK